MVALHDENAATGPVAAKLLERSDRARGFADHDRLGPLRQHGLDRPLDLRIRLDQLANEPAHPELGPDLRTRRQQVARPGPDVLTALDDLAQGVVAGAGGLGAAGRDLIGLDGRALRKLGLLVMAQREQELLLELVARREQVAKTLLETRLLTTRLARLGLLGLDVGVDTAQAKIDRRLSVAQVRDSILESRNRSQEIDVGGILLAALRLERPQRFLGDLNLALGVLDRSLLLHQTALELLELGAGRAVLVLGDLKLLGELGELTPAGVGRLLERVALAARELDSTFQGLDLAADAEEPFSAAADGLLGFSHRDALLLRGELALRELRLGDEDRLPKRGQGRGLLRDLRMQTRPLVGGERELEDPLRLVEALVAGGLLGLALEAPDLALDLAEHVVHAHEILFGRLHLAFGFAPAGLVLADSGRLFDQAAAILGLGGDDFGDLALLDDRVATKSDAGVAEEVVNVLQPRGLLVHQVFGLTRAVETPRDLDLAVGGERCGRLAVGVVEGQRDLGHADRRAVLRAREDHVVHALAAELAGRLLAHHPLDGIDDVRLAATVRSDHAGHPRIEAEDRAVDEGLEAVELQTLDAQAIPRSIDPLPAAIYDRPSTIGHRPDRGLPWQLQRAPGSVDRRARSGSEGSPSDDRGAAIHSRF